MTADNSTTSAKSIQPSARLVFTDPVMLAAFGFGSGLAPKAPGTFGTLVGIPFFLLMQDLSLLHFSLLTTAFFAIGCWFCGYAANKLGVHDHGGIVWDEIVGFLITMLPVYFIEPQAAWMNEWTILAMAFLAFRFFDIIKPAPIKWADARLPGGFGIMFDDLLAGVYAAGALALAMLYL